MATATLRKAELFVHPSHGRAVRATEHIPAGAVVLVERPLFALTPAAVTAGVVAEAAKARACEAPPHVAHGSRRQCLSRPTRRDAPGAASLTTQTTLPRARAARCASSRCDARALATQAVAALKCEPSAPEHLLAFCAAPPATRDAILQLYDGGGPSQWPKALPDSDTFPCVLLLAVARAPPCARKVCGPNLAPTL